MNYNEFWAKRAQGMRSSAIRDAFSVAEESQAISFAGGFPAKETFPVELIQEIHAKMLREDNSAALQYGPTEGLKELRLLIAEQMQSEGVDCDWENILITSGSQQGLDLIAKVMVDPGDVVLVEMPGYIGGLSAVNNYEAELVGIPLDEEGIRTDLLESKLTELRMRGRRVKFVYVVPNFHNPTGATLSLSRRQELLRVAEEHNLIILEDNPYGQLRFTGESLPHLKALDENNRVVYLGSFSKVFSPGVRVGWLVGDKEVVRKLTIAKQGTDLCSPSYGQKLVAEVLKAKVLPEHIASLRSVYAARRDAMLEALARFMPQGCTWTRPEGGFFVWLQLPAGIDAQRMLPAAIEEGVAYVSGGPFHVDNIGQNTIRLAYSQVTPEEITEGVRRLARAVKGVLKLPVNF